MVTETDVRLSDGRTLYAYDTGEPGSAGDARDRRVVVVWHPGTPNVGAPPAPLFATAARLGMRWVSYDRPGYGGSSPNPGRDLASAAAEVAELADALGVARLAVMGTREARPTPSPAPPCCRTAWWRPSGRPGSPRSARRGWSGSPA